MVRSGADGGGGIGPWYGWWGGRDGGCGMVSDILTFDFVEFKLGCMREF